MADPTPPTNDAAAIQKLIAESVTSAVATATKALSDQFAELTKNQKILADTLAADKSAKKEEPLTLDTVNKLLADALGKQAEAQKSSAARDAFIESNLKNVPAIYHSKLGADPSKWADEAKAIRQGVQDDLKRLGLKAPNIGGDPGGDTPSGDAANAETAKTAKVAQLKASGLSDGEADFAATLVVPTR